MLTIQHSPLSVLINSGHNMSGSHHSFHFKENVTAHFTIELNQCLSALRWSVNLTRLNPLSYKITVEFVFVRDFSELGLNIFMPMNMNTH